MDKKWEKILKDYDLHCLRVAKATTININEAVADKHKRIAMLEKVYIQWFEYYFPHFAKKKSAPYHQKLADRVIKHQKGKTLAEIYRSGGKSVHIDMGIPMYMMVTGRMKFMLLFGETDIKAKVLISDIQSELQYNHRFINDYGRKFKYGDWSSGKFSTTDGVRFVSLGFGQSPRGLREGADRPDYIVVDDVDSKKHINNDRIMRESVDYIMEDIMGCFDSSDDSNERFVYANNNFHKNSITNRLKQEFKNAIQHDREENKTSQYHVLTVCAVKDLVNFEPTWPGKTTPDYWRSKYQKRRRSFMREYMHSHIEDGAIFKHEDILWAKPIPLRQYDALCFYGDLSYKDNADYKALILVGKTAKEFHILLVYLRQKSRADAARWLYDMYELYQLHKLNIRYLIEGLFAQDEFVGEFDNEGEKRGYYIPVVADKRPKTDKYDRIESLAGHFERHSVYFNQLANNSDMQVLIDQFLAFEKGSQAHDDGPDATHGAFSYINKRTHSKKTRYAHGARQNRKY